jgi:hypothetical protein
MKNTFVAGAIMISSSAQAHSLPSLPDGIAHNLLHLAPFAVAFLLVGLISKYYSSSK